MCFVDKEKAFDHVARKERVGNEEKVSRRDDGESGDEYLCWCEDEGYRWVRVVVGVLC